MHACMIRTFKHRSWLRRGPEFKEIYNVLDSKSSSESDITMLASGYRRHYGSISSSSEISIPPYEVVPATRPIIIIGPSLRGYEITDMMHKALYHYVRKRFKGKVQVIKTHSDVGLSKRAMKINPNEKERFKISGAQTARMTVEVQREVERIYELSKSLNLVVIDCDVMNHPSQLVDCSLAPMLIYLKIEPSILEKLIKLRGSGKKHMGVQVVAATKISQCSEEIFDLVLDEPNLEDACEHLGEFLEQYWRDLHPSDPENFNNRMKSAYKNLQVPGLFSTSTDESKVSNADRSRSPSHRISQVQAPQQQQLVPTNVSPHMGQKHGRQGQPRQKDPQQNQNLPVAQLGQMDMPDGSQYQGNMSQYQHGGEGYTDQYYGGQGDPYEGGDGGFQHDYNQSYQDYNYSHQRNQDQNFQNQQQDPRYQDQYDQGQYQDYGQDYGSSQPYSSEPMQYGDYTQQYVQDPANYGQGYPDEDMSQGIVGYNEHLNPQVVDNNQYYGQEQHYQAGYY